MQTVSIKECKTCGATYYASNVTIELVPNQLVEILYNKVRDCPHCPDDTEPRDIAIRIYD